MRFDPLIAFADWFLSSPFQNIHCPKYEINYFGQGLGIVLYRHGQFQVELFIIAPGQTGFPENHAHPNVDSFELNLCGEIFFNKNSVPVADVDDIKNSPSDGLPLYQKQLVRVYDKEMHGAIVDERGAAFLSIQFWKNGVSPTSVTKDWTGNPIHKDHKI